MPDLRPAGVQAIMQHAYTNAASFEEDRLASAVTAARKCGVLVVTWGCRARPGRATSATALQALEATAVTFDDE
eukprot:6250088-Lingulodinium_polyedra.AAC.1